jgi:hypothetical protein
MEVPTDPRVIVLHHEWQQCVLGQQVDISDSVAFDLETGVGVDVGYYKLVADPTQIKVAVADYDCRESTDYLAHLTVVQSDLETAFLAEHQPELDAMRAAAG